MIRSACYSITCLIREEKEWMWMWGWGLGQNMIYKHIKKPSRYSYFTSVSSHHFWGKKKQYLYKFAPIARWSRQKPSFNFSSMTKGFNFSLFFIHLPWNCFEIFTSPVWGEIMKPHGKIQTMSNMGSIWHYWKIFFVVLFMNP